ncbi:hypothetical protein H8S37_15530 [Mediterraneibacter sp. NSJ-55]|uniref:Uncharacterized protein n=1 Tax=Mediterraneibacter hominis TaxID=2763054 RepID=A0A923LLP9_9FIRM|nr:hypothetical protein [Mediterraneibacter hominis]MBC5690327.1 hypothetical protein [Mediterraneibacter hominis]
MSDWKVIKFIRRHIAVIVSVLITLIIVGYFVNIMFVKNKKDAVSVLVLKPVMDTSALEHELSAMIEVGKGEEIHIQSIDFDVPANEAIATTWLRSGTIDIVIGREDQIEFYEAAGYLDEIQSVEGDIPGMEADAGIEEAKAALTANMPHEENARAVFAFLGKR